MYDDTFDGAQLNVGNDKVQVQGAYGYMMAGAAMVIPNLITLP